MPIGDGESVIGIFLVDTNLKDTTSCHYYHAVLPFYIEGYYNDYGGIEDTYGLMIDTIVSSVEKYVVPGQSNRFDDELVTKETLHIDHLVNQDPVIVQLPRLGVIQNAPCSIQHVQIRKNIFDEILEKFEWDARYSGSRTKESFATCMSSYNQFYLELEVDRKKNPYPGHGFSSTWQPKESSVLHAILNDNTRYENHTGMITAMHHIHHLLSTNGGMTEEALYPVVENAVAMEVLNLFMHQMNRVWAMPGHASQRDDTDVHEMFASIVIEEAEFFQRRYYEEL